MSGATARQTEATGSPESIPVQEAVRSAARLEKHGDLDGAANLLQPFFPDRADADVAYRMASIRI